MEMAGRQAHVAPDLLAVVELAVEDFTDQHRGNRSDAPELDKLPNLLGIAVG